MRKGALEMIKKYKIMSNKITLSKDEKSISMSADSIWA